MKRRHLLLLACILLAACKSAEVHHEQNVLAAFSDINTERSLEDIMEEGLARLGVNPQKELPAQSLSAIHYILKHTYEDNIHKMRGEEDNVVYTNEDGREAVFDRDGNLVTNDWNKGSFNYGNYDKPIDKFLLDIWPWLVWGNARTDPTTFDERLDYYCYDLDIGIQSYIFMEDSSDLERISFQELEKEERLVYHLFNASYRHQLTQDSRTHYQESAELYRQYLVQIFRLIGYDVT